MGGCEVWRASEEIAVSITSTPASEAFTQAAEAMPEVENLQEPQPQAVKRVVRKKPAEKPVEVIEVIIHDDSREDTIEEEIVAPPEELVRICGPLTCMDPCFQTITVDGTTVDVSAHPNFPMYRTYRPGDLVEVAYLETASANVLQSIEFLQEP